MNKSIWQNEKSCIKTTRKRIETDILIIGGGITGITTLLNLKDEDVILIESNKIGENTTGLSTAKISVMQEYNYQKIENIVGKNKTQKYLKSQVYARDLLINNIKKYNLDCDLVKNKSYLFTNNEKNINRIIKEKNILDKEIKTSIIKELPNNYPCIYGIQTTSFVFNPVKYMLGIKQMFKDKIYENTRAIKIEKKLNYYLVKTNRNKIKANKVIICTHYPILIKKYLIPLKTTIEKEYVLSAKVDKSYNIDMISNDNELTSIRYYKDNVIYAGFRGKLCESIDHNENMNSLIKKFKNHFPYKITNTWYNYDITSNDYLPIISKLKKEFIYFSTAYNKWGITNGILSASILSDLVQDKENEYKDLFSYYRKTNIKKIIKSIFYIFNNVQAFLFNKQRFIKYKYNCGKQYSFYQNYKVLNKCPHLGCKLTFNEIDNTWDCPCHGSRYNIDGKVIKGPSTESIKKNDGI